VALCVSPAKGELLSLTFAIAVEDPANATDQTIREFPEASFNCPRTYNTG